MTDSTDTSETAVTAGGGWCATTEMLYPEVTARRGGLSFSDPLGLEALTEEQLRERVRALTEITRKQSRRIQKLRRKNDRLIRLVGRLV